MLDYLIKSQCTGSAKDYMRRMKMARCINTLLCSAARTVSVSKMENTDSGVLGAASLVSLEGAVTVWVRSKYEHSQPSDGMLSDDIGRKTRSILNGLSFSSSDGTNAGHVVY